MAESQVTGNENEQTSNPFSFTNFIKKQRFQDSSEEVDGDRRDILQDGDLLIEKKDNIGKAENDIKVDSPFLPKVTTSNKKKVSKRRTKNKEDENNQFDIFSQDDEIIKLQLSNAELKKKLIKVTSERDEAVAKNAKLTEDIKILKRKDAEETVTLEQMTEKIEQNLQIATKRAIDAEGLVATLTKDLLETQASNAVLKQQLNSTITAKENIHYASEQLHTVARNAKESIKKLVSDADSLNLVADVLSSFDKFEEKI